MWRPGRFISQKSFGFRYMEHEQRARVHGKNHARYHLVTILMRLCNFRCGKTMQTVKQIGVGKEFGWPMKIVDNNITRKSWGKCALSMECLILKLFRMAFRGWWRRRIPAWKSINCVSLFHIANAGIVVPMHQNPRNKSAIRQLLICLR